ncbi:MULTISPECIES: ComF family protein [Staphylococcus]|uniref:ComF family protein n=1 Tax=Staphylococcus TaxID=1279 RepID=UPI000764125C|nr:MULTISPECIES: ComF family protein [Staphylococcus]KXA44449.1 comF family protein [Staphylococcus simulans]OFM14898.1 competence protein ComF [Staphylococcus sp. HMSC059E03]OFN23049.1 competence protein ComF [Staphylococcus sp. HMSC055C03]OFU81085.1 competence protein ComF [Staphylococcus sp. HMSC10C03]OFV06277.1 competence protein ComF [Staphylococcus sp. HMSC12H08]
MPKCKLCLTPFSEPLTAANFYKSPQILCEHCRQAFEACRLEKVKRCPRCLKPLDESEEACLDCQFLVRKFNLMHQLHCDYRYTGKVRETIHQYKIAGDTALCEVIANLIRLPKQQYDYIIPIPSPIARDQQRTFNPVEMVLAAKGVKYHLILQTDVRPKQSTLNKAMRAKAPNPFYINPAFQDVDLQNKRILLVDDIYTTGLTAHHAIEALFIRKVGKIDVFAFAR